MQRLYRYDQIGPATQVFGVVADPVAQSLSPLVHNRGFQMLGLDAVYLPFRVPKEHFREFIADARELGICGLSITIPHKEEAIRCASKMESEVIGIRAANTLLFEEDGQIIAANTDAPAAVGSLERVVDPSGEIERPLAGKRILILGTGGVARGLAWGFARRGADVTISGRKHENAEQLARELGLRAIDWVAKHSMRPDIIVNGTPVGMHPHVDETPFEKSLLKTHMIVFDTVYNPEQTLLIKQAREMECRVVTGTEMFVRQAVLQFQRFTGRRLSKRQTLEQVRRAISAVHYDDDDGGSVTPPPTNSEPSSIDPVET